ncbi:hypothetical protein D0Z00_004721, partial [Geotrichum galactomycetum]
TVTSTLTLTKPTTIVKGDTTIYTQFTATVTTCPPVTITTLASEAPSGSVFLTLTRTKSVPVVSGSVTSYSAFYTTITTCVATPTVTPTFNQPETTVVVTKSVPVIVSGSTVTFTKMIETVTVEHSKAHTEIFESSTFAVEFSTPAVPTGSAPVSSSVPKNNGGFVSSTVAQATSSGSGNPPAVVSGGSTSLSQVNGASTRSISGIVAACFCVAAFLI